MNRIISILTIVAMVSFLFSACEKDDTKSGSLTLAITDAPIDNSTVAGVYLTITEIQYHKNDSEWTTFEEFVGPQTFNILELTDGNSELLGTFDLDAGRYTQLRFMLDAPGYGTPNPSNPGCYIKLTDETEEPLFVPSGHESGWKGVGSFVVPSNGDVAVTADFDARKSVVQTGGMNSSYILKPTIRLIVDNQAGKIVGGVTNMPADSIDVIIYAYEDGIYTATEAEEPANDTIPRFPNAVTSDIVDENSSYHLVFLAPMTYDLIVTTSIEGEFQEVLGIIEDVIVESKKTTSQPIDLNTL